MNYPIVEHFYTLQGEGCYAGRSAYFIRLAGCDVGCVWCDTKESWDASKHPTYSVETIVSWVEDSGADLAVITGGEPLMHNLTELTAALHAKHIQCNLETSGAYELSGDFDWICVSPKKFKKALPSVLEEADELKVIVFNEHDLKWAETFEDQVHEDCLLYLQPEWDNRLEQIPAIIKYIKEHTQWSMSLQWHKYLAIP
ncbi:MAG: 7-carboxy-7-deazaguanine synthase QueE [Chitinophagales bacterium]|nr:7-carboxy-7-deazaguanine synthase QueE [Chitinophagales bacterium]